VTKYLSPAKGGNKKQIFKAEMHNNSQYAIDRNTLDHYFGQTEKKLATEPDLRFGKGYKPKRNRSKRSQKGRIVKQRSKFSIRK
jgi:hypothetical protein